MVLTLLKPKKQNSYIIYINRHKSLLTPKLFKKQCEKLIAVMAYCLQVINLKSTFTSPIRATQDGTFFNEAIRA